MIDDDDDIFEDSSEAVQLVTAATQPAGRRNVQLVVFKRYTELCFAFLLRLLRKSEGFRPMNEV